MSAVDIRLLSPMKRRVYPNPSSSAGTGAMDMTTWKTLIAAGWREYAGPATTDGRGWVKPGSDPAVVPLGPKEQWR